MIFKICGLKNKESLLCCEENNVDFLELDLHMTKDNKIVIYHDRNIIQIFATVLAIQ